MKAILSVTVLVLILAVMQVKAQSTNPPENLGQKVGFAKAKVEDVKAKSYDPCNSDPNAHYYCSSACYGIGYYNGGLCIGYSCYCYV